LATVGSDGQPSVIPICYAFDGRYIFSSVDEKPKSVGAGQLKRVINIESNPRVSLVIDDYSDDWSQLAYVLIQGLAEVLNAGGSPVDHKRGVSLLREKYVQYRSMAIDERPLIKIAPTRIKSWSFS
jgi:PPOX class probable F420-dependent enzyme